MATVRILRVLWLLLALVGVGLAGWYGTAPMAAMFADCTKLVTVDNEHRCGLSVGEAYGWWRIVLFGLLVAVPPAAAAATGRQVVAWLAVGALVVLAVVGLLDFFGFWGFLVVAGPMALVAVVLAVLVRRCDLDKPPRKLGGTRSPT
ncbi:MAG: hypothetical protein GX610_16750 [Rhodococcus sp.]|nr:hypothetical protein [Rhodococcus sp. (in: high G+C Gram-positive bacteria)]